MLLNSSNLKTLGIGFKAAYQGALGHAPNDHLKVCSIVTSSNKAEEYGWLGKMPNVREWIGDRVIHGMQAHGYTIKNKPFELTVAVDRDDVSDDNLGIYGPMFTEMGMSTGAHECRLVFDLLAAGFATTCYDGQYFFDIDHPVLDKDGQPTMVANTDNGAGSPWFLFDSKGSLKPIILQKRKDWEFVSRDSPEDSNVFSKKEFQYGTDARMNAGYGFWQKIWGSKQPLTPANYAAARAALASMKGDYGRPLGIMPDTLVCSPANEGAARALLGSQLINGGETNIWAGTAKLEVVPWL